MRTALIVGCLVLFAVWMSAAGTAGQKASVENVLGLIQRNYEPIRDYKVDVEVAVDSPQIYVSKSRSTMYFKRPNRVKIVARDGFAVLPETFEGNPVEAIKSGFEVEYVGARSIRGEAAHVLRLFPKSGTSWIWVMQLFVEKRRGVILGTEGEVGDTKLTSRWTWTRVEGKYWLPSGIDMDMTMPAPAVTRGRSNTEAPKPMRATSPVKLVRGKTTVRFSGYRVNRGIPDSVFVEKKGARK